MNYINELTTPMERKPFTKTLFTNRIEAKQQLEYKTIVEKIKALHWEKLDSQELQQLMHLSYISAREFAASLRIALQLYPEDAALQEMARGELLTDNLAFEDYSQRGDHGDFLAYFLRKHHLTGDSALQRYGKKYLDLCKELDDSVRAMTIFSREAELPGIFQRILQAKDWSASGLPAFRYYLERHIALDSQDGGHGDLTKKFPVDDRVKPFYAARLDMYTALPKLFERDSTIP